MSESGYFPPAAQDKTNTGETTAVPPHLDNTALIKLMHCLTATQENACSCDETFALLDQYVELAVSGQQIAQLMPLVERHMEQCPDCHQEYEVLLNILEAEMRNHNA